MDDKVKPGRTIYYVHLKFEDQMLPYLPIIKHAILRRLATEVLRPTQQWRATEGVSGAVNPNLCERWKAVKDMSKLLN